MGDQGGAGGSSYCDLSGVITSNLQGINNGHGFVNMLLTRNVSSTIPTSVPTFFATKRPATNKIPTYKPSIKPYFSLQPTESNEFHGSNEPTMASTSLEAYFQVTQTFYNLNFTAIDSPYGVVSIQQAVSQSLNSQVPPEYVQIMSMTQATTSQTTIVYMIYFFSSSTKLANAMYNDLCKQLVTSITEGTFQTYFISAALSQSIAGATQVSVTESPVISDLETFDTTVTYSPITSVKQLGKGPNQNNEPSPVISGVIAAGVVTCVAAIVIFLYLFYRKSVIPIKLPTKKIKGTNVIRY